MREVFFGRSGHGGSTRAHPKLDVRLTTLAELTSKAYGESPGSLESRLGFRREGPLAFLRVASPFESSRGGEAVQVFLTVRERAAFARLTAAHPHLWLHSQATTIATADVLLSDLAALEASDDVVAIEWTGAVRPTSGPAGVGGPYTARAAMGLEQAPADLDGRGSLIGIVDLEGIDLYHPAFLDTSARTRLRALWDQRLPADDPKGPNGDLRGALVSKGYGRLYDHAALDREVSPRQLVPNEIVKHRARKGSHGSASASLAAGLPFREHDASGVASGAELVFVNTWSSGVGSLGAMTELADAIAFVFEVAESDHKPCVVSVSLGDDLGPRNGQSPVERFIDELCLRKGRAVVVAAGNSGEKKRHVGRRIGEGETVTLDIDVGERNDRHAAIEIWYRAEREGGLVELQIEAPDGEGPTTVVPADGIPRAFDSGQTRALAISVADVAASPGDKLLRVELLPLGDTDLVAGTWRLHLRAKGSSCQADAWLDHPFIRFLTPAGDTDLNTLCTPATSRGAITVGAYHVEKSAPYWFSGRGPGRGDARKPDVMAPGGPIIVASSSTAGRTMSASGTSVAAPLVAGAVALAYQRFGPELSRDELLDKLLPGGRDAHDDAAGWGLVHLAHWFAAPA